MGDADEHTFVFADLSGFTALTEVHGDEEAPELAAGFFDDARALLAEHAADEVKNVDPEHAAGTLAHEGREYHFCSLQCARKFADLPERYAGAF
jgi:YHS domain-containing protein